MPLTLSLGAIVGDGLLPTLARWRAQGSIPPLPRKPLRVEPLGSALLSAAVVAITLFALKEFNGALPLPDQLNLTYVSVGERAAMQWAAVETPPSSRFLIITEFTQWSGDTISEWFPVIANRVSVVTPQGSEWLPNGAFLTRVAEHGAAQACGSADGACL